MSSLSEFPDLMAHDRWLRRLARSLVFDRGAVDDVVQQTWLQVTRTPPESPGQLRGFLTRLLPRVARERAQAETRRAAREAKSMGFWGPSREGIGPTDVAVEKLEWHRSLAGEVIALNEPYRSAIILRYVEDLTPKTIARRLGIEESTVRSRIHRGIGQLRSRLQSSDDPKSRGLLLAVMGLAKTPPIAVHAWIMAAVLIGLGGVVTWALLPQDLDSAMKTERVPQTEARLEGKGAALGAPLLVPAASHQENQESETRVVQVTDRPSEHYSIRGQCFNPGGDRLGGVLIRLAREEGASPPSFEGQEVFHSGMDGTFSIDWKEASSCALEFVAGESRTMRRWVGGGSETFQDLGTITLFEPPSVKGRVIDEQGRPIGGAEVGSSDWIDCPKTLTEADGTFHLPVNQWRSRYSLYAVRDDLAPSVAESSSRDENGFIITLRAGRSVEGVVVDGDGKGIQGVEIGLDLFLHRITNTGAMFPLNPARRVFTSHTGSFRMDQVPLGQCHLKLRHEGYSVGYTIIDPDDTTSFQYVMHRQREPRMIGGVVVDQTNGQPIGGADIDGRETSHGSGTFEIEERMDPIWLKRTEGLSMRIQAEGYVMKDLVIPWPADGEAFPPLRVEMIPAVMGRGLVVDLRGQPLGGANFWFYHEDEPGSSKFRAKSDDNGFFSVPLKPGRYVHIEACVTQHRHVQLEGFDAVFERPLEFVFVCHNGKFFPHSSWRSTWQKQR